MDVQRTGRIFGWLFIGTFVTSIPARLLFVDGLGASWDDMRFIPGAGSETSLKLGAILEFGVIVFNIATAVYLSAREATERDRLARVRHRSHHGVGLHRDRPHQHHLGRRRDRRVGGRQWRRAVALAVEGNSLVNTYEWAFLFGPGLVVGFGNGLMLGYLMYRSGLVPRRMAMLGSSAGPC